MKKRMVVFVIMVLVFATCSVEARDERMPDAVRNELEQKGFIVQEGKMDFPDIIAWCCQCQLPNCYANNPSSPYGIVVLPPAPNQSSSVKNPYTEWFYQDGHYPKGWSTGWRLRADEAVVYIGMTPPRMDYFGFTGYLYDRYMKGFTSPPCTSQSVPSRETPESAQNRLPLFASLGDTINNAVVNVSGDKRDPFNKTVVFIMATDKRIEQEVRKTLWKAGYPDQVINTIVIPASIVRQGVESDSDTFNILLRVASDKTPELLAYMASPMSVFRVSPALPLPSVVPLETPKLRVRGTGETEISLVPAMDALGEAIVAHYPQYQAVKIATMNWYEGYNCIENGQPCLGDNRDTPYIPPAFNPMTGALFQNMKLREGEFYVAYGVNHQETRKATYSNVSVLGWTHKASPVVLKSDDMPGTAQYYLGSTINRATANKLYAWKVARPGGCEAGETAGSTPPPQCKEVGYACYDGIAADDNMALVFRAYMEPKTKVAPAYGEIIIDRIIKFTPMP